jgi:hypothetical protein
MKFIQEYETTEVYGESKPFPVGPQVCKITNVTDVPEKSYLMVEFDIIEGELKDYFKTLYEHTEKWYGVTYRSYKLNALPYFKAFIAAVEKSNPGYNWNWNENELIGKILVVNFREEEYIYNNEIKVNVKPFEFRSLLALKEGKINLKPDKLSLRPEELASFSSQKPVLEEIPDDELPF